MTKKQKIISFSAVTVLSVISLAAAGGYFYVNSKNDSLATVVKSSTSAGVAGTLDPSQSDSISLQPKQKPQGDSGGLSVSDSSNSSAQLGSGRQTNVSGNNSSSNSSSPSPDSFKEYEQYKDKNEVLFGEIQEGSGKVAQKDSQLAVTYKGYLTTGQMFDQSRPGDNGQLQPLLFTLGGGQLIPGFEQGVAGMKAGGTRRVIIPPALAYGDKEQNGIPANSVLIFDIQLIASQ